MLNYGFLGSILGHELAHGFDNTGRKFDHEGNEHMWWTQQTIEEYEKRTNCFIDHYESYLVPGIEEKVSSIGMLTYCTFGLSQHIPGSTTSLSLFFYLFCKTFCV